MAAFSRKQPNKRNLRGASSGLTGVPPTGCCADAATDRVQRTSAGSGPRASVAALRAEATARRSRQLATVA